VDVEYLTVILHDNFVTYCNPTRNSTTTVWLQQ